jgi:hypothetical protein
MEGAQSFAVVPQRTVRSVQRLEPGARDPLVWLSLDDGQDPLSLVGISRQTPGGDVRWAD